MTDSYKDYLKSEHWKETRDKRVEMDGHKCYLCGHRRYLNVHHLRYDNLWHEDIDKDLVTLCRRCHVMLHRIKDESKKELAHYYYTKKHRTSAKKIRAARNRLSRCVRDKVIEELWLRDVNFGGDLKVFNNGMRMIKKMVRIVEILYPEIELSDVEETISKKLKKVSFGKKLKKKELENKRPASIQKKGANT